MCYDQEEASHCHLRGLFPLGNTSDSDSVVSLGSCWDSGLVSLKRKWLAIRRDKRLSFFLCNFGIASFAHFLSIVIF